MRLNHIQFGIPISVFVGENREREFRAKFIDNTDDTVFFIFCPELLACLSEYIGASVSVEFAINDQLFKSECRISDKGGRRKNYDTITLESVSGFLAGSRRSSDRFDIQVLTNIFNYCDNKSTDFKGEFICDSISSNISKGGMSLSSRRRLKDIDDSMYTLEFSVRPNSLFSYYYIPSKIVRSGRSISAFSSGYEYGFVFFFDQLPDVQKRLFNDLFNTKLLSALR